MDRTGVPKGDFPELKRLLGDRLNVRGYDSDTDDGRIIRRHLADLDRLPKDLLQKVTDAGLSLVLIGPGSIADLPGYRRLEHVPVPGRKDGRTFGDLSGCYDGKNRAILLGTSDPVEPHVVDHEFSHALIHAMDYLDDFRVTRCYREMAGTLHDFYVPGGVQSRSGMDEFLADVLAGAIIYGERFLEGYPDYFADFVLSVALKGRAPRAK